MDLIVVTVLRLIHIFAGVFWAGAAFLISGFIEPAVRATGPDGGKFLQYVMQKTSMSLTMNIASALTTLTGILLFWWASGGLQLSWMASAAGLSFTIGSLAGILSLLTGTFVTAPSAKRLGAVVREMQNGSGPPMPARLAEMTALQNRLTQSGRVSSGLLVVTVVGMAVARYI